MPGIGIPELTIVLVIVLLIFGPKRLPQLGKQLGGGMREFKDSIQGKDKDADDADEDAAAGRPELTRAQQRPSARWPIDGQEIAGKGVQAATDARRGPHRRGPPGSRARAPVHARREPRTPRVSVA